MSQTVHGHLLGNHYLHATAMLVVAVATLAAAVHYPASLPLLLLNGLLTGLLVRSVLNNRSSFFSFFLLAFLILGCWAKLVLHFILGTQFIEPIGAFDESPQAWDSAMLALNIAFATLLACQAIVARLPPPAVIHIKHPRALLMPSMWLAMLLTALLLAFNFKFAILKVGTEPLLKLHSYAYVLVSFMLAWGNLILLATLGYWLVQARQMKLETLFYILILEGAVTAVSMGSRAQMILHVAAPFAVYLVHGRELVSGLRLAQWVRILLVTAALFVASLLLVSADRLQSFAQARPVSAPAATSASSPSFAPGASPSSKLLVAPADAAQAVAGALLPAMPLLRIAAQGMPLPPVSNEAASVPVVRPEVSEEVERARWKGMLMEMSKLVVDRWIGLEGVLAVVSHDSTGWPLFLRSLVELPESGTEAIYQRMSNAQYQAFENFTFMTIPGPMAILLYSGKLTVLAGGLAMLFLTGILAERLANYLVGNIFARATIGVALAYLVVQTNFPRVQFFFLIELLGFIAGLYLARIIVTAPRSGKATPAPAFE
ncbi:hypothetical protein PPUJ20028_26890 [Pseudomonas putida]|uniref:Uncharacterized protein n=1 Tax=Pseudomonas putida TaxID=303 RepID=A0AA37R7L8_PSEPU|nr:hypothetical protein [Pseudomonas putida]GLO14107.1 hypothetical protein PPUJ20028_26890 [Pseudomonas putida]GLO33885.1 hypothetical protein PPUN14671_07180 [Pseudomonas putida]HDS0965900.1 hypothetical protein [Pseudomonas putida]HDS0991156.1 hypothetical protein [Pseudomonas putida]